MKIKKKSILRDGVRGVFRNAHNIISFLEENVNKSPSVFLSALLRILTYAVEQILCIVREWNTNNAKLHKEKKYTKKYSLHMIFVKL